MGHGELDILGPEERGSMHAYADASVTLRRGAGATAFDPGRFACFRFVRRSFDPATGVASLDYALDDELTFRERVIFPNAPFNLPPARRAVLDAVLGLLHLVAGTSYFKAALPPTVAVETGPVSVAQDVLLRDLYSKGLAEFAYRNSLTVPPLTFGAPLARPVGPDVLPSQPRCLVPVGGGKDSVVSLESLRRRGYDVTLMSVGEALPIRKTVLAAELPHILVRRELSSNLLELNEAGAYNGHVPVTAVVSLIALATAVLFDFRDVVMSNERSASVGSEVAPGIVVNHQYSKGLEFEHLLRVALGEISSSLRYFSLLRPFSELSIARSFATMPRYWHAITSCNAAFRQSAGGEVSAWCGDCPKCRFVSLALAPFMTPDDLLGITGRDVLDDPRQVDGFALLLGLTGPKPFECVGEIAEARAALAMLNDQPGWRDKAVVRALGGEALASGPADVQFDAVLRADTNHYVPSEYSAVLHDIASD